MKNTQTVVIGEFSFFPECTLGKGSTGKVYKGNFLFYLGIRNKDKKPVAVKTIDLKDIDSSIKKHLLNCEVEALSKIKHPYICETYSILQDKSSFFVVMEECSKGTLKEYIKSKSNFCV